MSFGVSGDASDRSLLPEAGLQVPRVVARCAESTARVIRHARKLATPIAHQYERISLARIWQIAADEVPVPCTEVEKELRARGG